MTPIVLLGGPFCGTEGDRVLTPTLRFPGDDTFGGRYVMCLWKPGDSDPAIYRWEKMPDRVG